jgi:hypothetical protein
MGTDTEMLESTIARALWMVTKKEQLIIVNCILVLIEIWNEKFVTQKWQICYSSQ